MKTLKTLQRMTLTSVFSTLFSVAIIFLLGGCGEDTPAAGGTAVGNRTSFPGVPAVAFAHVKRITGEIKTNATTGASKTV